MFLKSIRILIKEKHFISYTYQKTCKNLKSIFSNSGQDTIIGYLLFYLT